jgi:hypothetical protein
MKLHAIYRPWYCMNVVSFTFCPLLPPCVYNCGLVSVVGAAVRTGQGTARLHVTTSANVRFEVLVAVSMKVTVLWGVTPSSPIDRYQSFGGICLLIYSDDGGSGFLRKFGSCSATGVASRPTRRSSRSVEMCASFFTEHVCSAGPFQVQGRADGTEERRCVAPLCWRAPSSNSAPC